MSQAELAQWSGVWHIHLAGTMPSAWNPQRYWYTFMPVTGDVFFRCTADKNGKSCSFVCGSVTVDLPICYVKRSKLLTDIADMSNTESEARLEISIQSLAQWRVCVRVVEETTHDISDLEEESRVKALQVRTLVSKFCCCQAIVLQSCCYKVARGPLANLRKITIHGRVIAA